MKNIKDLLKPGAIVPIDSETTHLLVNELRNRPMTVENLLKTNVNEHTEKKNNLTYLSWAWAWAEALKADKKATYKVEMFDGKCYMDINGTAMVWVTVTMFDKPMTCQLPVMNYKNQAIVNPDAFAVNTAIMRCMTKALSLHGLGLYIYAGEDLPEEDKPDLSNIMADHITAIQDATDEASLKSAYQAAYKACGTDANWQKKIIAVKDAKKASLK